MNVSDWRSFCAREPVLANRRQSLAFLRGESLQPVALRPTTNHLDPGAKRLIADWAHTDAHVSESGNWGAVLRPPYLDIDVDIAPLRGVRDAAFHAEALAVIESVENALRAAGVQFRAFGRKSLGYRGHLIVACQCTKDETALLANLHMAKPIRSNNVVVRIEVRRPAATKGSPKNFTLPGSVYLSKTDKSLDLIGWHALSDWREGEEMPGLSPTAFGKLKVGLYAALMALAIVPHWEQGSRHAMANLVAGALAREHMAGGLSEDDCAFVMEHCIAEAADDEPEDRLRCLTDSIHGLQFGRKVTGYTALAEVVGNDWKAALLRLRGGGDPDALATLFDNVVRIHEGLTKSNCYVDLSLGADLYSELDQTHVRARFKARKEYPRVADSKGKMTDAIEIVIHSPHQRTYDKAVTFPGIEFGAPFYWDTAAGRWENITDDDPAPDGATTAINVAAGFATPTYDETERPDKRDWETAKYHWFKLREHLTDGDEIQAVKLDQIIARKLQYVREKNALGCALVGGMGIGKSALFETVLTRLIGRDLLRKSTTAELKSEYRFTGIERSLFYYVEECRFDVLPTETLQMIKDVMRNSHAFRNEKYGKIGEVTNVTVPFFLSNEMNPRLMFDGKADRALVVIRGESQESLGYTQAQWTAHKRTIIKELQAFDRALDRLEIRQALLHYFLSLDTLAEITDDNEHAESDDLKTGLSAPLAAILEMIETGYILPERRGDRGPTITEPFTMETFAAGVRERLRNRGVSTFTTSNAGAGTLIAELFMENTRERGVHRSKGINREQREGKVLMSARHYHNGTAKRMYYFGVQRGRLIDMLKQMRGIEIDPEYELNGEEMGLTPPPSKEAMQKAFAFATELSAMQTFRGLGYT